MSRTARVVVVGAGIAGVSAGYHLAVRHGVDGIVLVDPRPPMTLTSDKSTECYRNWWPNPPMVELMNRSIDILEELAGETDFGLNRNGYLFVTGERPTLDELGRKVAHISSLGAESRLLERAELLATYPFLTEAVTGGVFVPRAGWFRAQDLGQWMLERSREKGTELIVAEAVAIAPGRVTLSDGTVIITDQIVIAAGPLSSPLAATAGLQLPLFSELHLKIAFRDHLGVIPRDAPMTIWSDAQAIAWSVEERAELAALGRHDLLGEMPVHCHFRPEGGAASPFVVALWDYHDKTVAPIWPLPEDPLYPEVVVRGLTTMVPGLAAYLDHLPESSVDGGYYTKTRENQPLIGPSGVAGIQLMTGMSGFGVMVSAGAADLLARHIVGLELPSYSDSFLLGRYDDPSYVAALSDAVTGQL